MRTGRDLPERRESGVSAAAAAVGVSVIVPVYNQAESIGGNIQTILDRVSRGLDEPVEIVVVSDGSVDQTEERALSVASDRVRVLHYERNLGKGYAIKAGALEARGEWIAFIDADLDLDPAAIPEFVRIARAKRLDFVIGSKRHPESDVFYPRSRRVASWLYQQLVRLLFRLDVRDTQVGLKVFRREIADEVMPFLLVKRFAFDLELLSVARAFGFRRIEERPVSLQYRFTGSGVRSLAVARALVDTAAIFYRLRVLRYYERRRTLGGRFGWTRPRDYVSHVTVVAAPTADLSHLDYPSLDIVSGLDRRAAAEQAEGELVAFVGEGATPASNWLRATVPFLARSEVDAVVTPSVAPHQGPRRAIAAAAVQESRLGGGSLYFRFTPGNVRFVRDYPTESLVVRKDAFLALPRDVQAADVVARVAEAGGRAIYTPEAVVAAPCPPLFRPHVRRVVAYGLRRGSALRRGRSRLRLTTVLPVALIAYLGFSWPLAVWAGGTWRDVWLSICAAYLVLVVVSGGVGGALRFRSLPVGLLAVVGLLVTHFVYGAALLRGYWRDE